MSEPPHNTRSDGRVTLPPIRDLFRDEFMYSPPGPRDTPPMLLAQPGLDGDGGEAHSPGSISPTSGGYRQSYKVASDQPFPPPQTGAYPDERLPPNTPPHGSSYQHGILSSISTPRSHTLPPPRWGGPLLKYGPSDSPSSDSHPHPFFQPTERRRNPPGNSSNQYPQPDQTSSSYPGYREHLQYDSNVQMPRLLSPPNPARLVQARPPDSPPPLVQAVAPWVIATNLEVGQVYEDDERTPIARPFDAGPMTRSASHPTLAGRFLDDGSQLPLGKYDCKFCGKLFNRPSSLRIHLNSHTGEKPFVCPHENCGRSFSVLSNMRRHARVHMENPKEQEPDESTDEASRQSSPTAPSMHEPSTVAQQTAPAQTLPRSQTPRRRGSRASASSSGSKQSPSHPSQDFQS